MGGGEFVSELEGEAIGLLPSPDGRPEGDEAEGGAC